MMSSRAGILRVLLLIGVVSVTLVEASEVMVKQHAVIRDGPSGTARRLGTAESGHRFPLRSTEAVNSWLRIEYEGADAWVYSRWVEVVGESAPQSITVASFNVLHLGWGNSKDIGLLATVIARYDVVALLEVMKDAPLSALDGELEATTGGDWRYIQSEFVGTGSYQESYVYIWNQDHVQFLTGSSFLVDDSEFDRFAREPFVASFKSGGFDFTLVALHAIWGDSKARRQAEATAAADVYKTLQDESDEENDIILMGDFNLPPDEPGWDDMKSMSSMFHVVEPPALTTVGTGGLTSLYDNLWFQRSYLAEFTGEGGAYNFVADLFEGEDEFREAREYVSDHLPVWGRFTTSGEDDD